MHYTCHRRIFAGKVVLKNKLVFVKLFGVELRNFSLRGLWKVHCTFPERFRMDFISRLYISFQSFLGFVQQSLHFVDELSAGLSKSHSLYPGNFSSRLFWRKNNFQFFSSCQQHFPTFWRKFSCGIVKTEFYRSGDAFEAKLNFFKRLFFNRFFPTLTGMFRKNFQNCIEAEWAGDFSGNFFRRKSFQKNLRRLSKAISDFCFLFLGEVISTAFYVSIKKISREYIFL